MAPIVQVFDGLLGQTCRLEGDPVTLSNLNRGASMAGWGFNPDSSV